MSYGKIFDSLYTGSMVGAGINVFAVWSYVIANAKPPGIIELNPKLLAATFGCDVAPVLDAIERLCSPDPESRTKEHEGRRLLPEGQFLYRIPTWAKYNQIRNEVERREKNREYARTYREKQKLAAADVSTDAADVSTDALTNQQSKPIRSVRTDSTRTASLFGEEEHEEERKPKRLTEMTVDEVGHEPGFVKFWNAYGRKQSKRDAARAWKSINPDEAQADEIIRAATAYAATIEPGKEQFQALPATWLNGRRWEDAPVKRADPEQNKRPHGYDKFGRWHGPRDDGKANYSDVIEEDDCLGMHPKQLLARENGIRASQSLPPLTMEQWEKENPPGSY